MPEGRVRSNIARIVVSPPDELVAQTRISKMDLRRIMLEMGRASFHCCGKREIVNQVSKDDPSIPGHISKQVRFGDKVYDIQGFRSHRPKFNLCDSYEGGQI